MVRQLKEAFTLLDKDGDGTINEGDLEEMLVSLGQNPGDAELKAMLSLMPQPITFSSYLTGMSNHLCALSGKEELVTAFEAFGDDSTESASCNGIPVEELKQLLTSHGMAAQDVDTALGEFMKRGFLGDRIDYKALVGVLRE